MCARWTPCALRLEASPSMLVALSLVPADPRHLVLALFLPSLSRAAVVPPACFRLPLTVPFEHLGAAAHPPCAVSPPQGHHHSPAAKRGPRRLATFSPLGLARRFPHVSGYRGFVMVPRCLSVWRPSSPPPLCLSVWLGVCRPSCSRRGEPPLGLSAPALSAWFGCYLSRRSPSRDPTRPRCLSPLSRSSLMLL